MRSQPLWSLTGSLTDTPVAVALPRDWGSLTVDATTLALAQFGTAYTPPAVANVSGVTTISMFGSPTGGTFALQVKDDGGNVLATTAAIPYNETAPNIKTALVNTGRFASGDITAGGGALPTDVTLTWTGVYAAVAPRLEAVSTLLTGGANPRVRAERTTAAKGNGGYVYTPVQLSVDEREGPWGSTFLYLAAAAAGDTGTYYVSAYR